VRVAAETVPNSPEPSLPTSRTGVELTVQPSCLPGCATGSPTAWSAAMASQSSPTVVIFRIVHIVDFPLPHDDVCVHQPPLHFDGESPPARPTDPHCIPQRHGTDEEPAARVRHDLVAPRLLGTDAALRILKPPPAADLPVRLDPRTRDGPPGLCILGESDESAGRD